MKGLGVGGSAIQGRGVKRAFGAGAWGRCCLGCSACFGGLWEGGPVLGLPLTLPFSVFLKIPCVPAAVRLQI